MKSFPENNYQLLVIDDDPLLRSTLALTITAPWKVTAADRLNSGLFAKHWDAVFVDMHLSGSPNKAEGIEIIRKLSPTNPHMEIVAMSGNLDHQIMEQCLAAGAQRFLAKPLVPEEVDHTLRKIEALILLRRFQLHPADSRPRWIGQSSHSHLIQREIAQCRGESGPVLIEGESGTGKELVARLLHLQEGVRPFVTINMASVPENLFESELFGHQRGSFTGAEQNKMGLVEVANGGDLFLDEIEALPLSSQAKLLRFLELGEIRRVGAKDSLQVRVRVIAATNRDLMTMVDEGKFRADLWWRLAGKKISLAPLRQRKEDIVELANHILARQRPRHNKQFTEDALALLVTYHWPGNVRELIRVCEQLCLASPLPCIRKVDVAKIIGSQDREPQKSIKLELDPSQPLNQGLTPLMNQFEKHLIEKVLFLAQDIEEAIKLLKISRSGLYKKMKDYGIVLENTKRNAPPAATT